jgi:hypothetical protein
MRGMIASAAVVTAIGTETAGIAIVIATCGVTARATGAATCAGMADRLVARKAARRRNAARRRPEPTCRATNCNRRAGANRVPVATLGRAATPGPVVKRVRRVT